MKLPCMEVVKNSVVRCSQYHLTYYKVYSIYRRTGFNCETLIIANCEIISSSQKIETQTKIYAINVTWISFTPVDSQFFSVLSSQSEP